ncbi:hypothetical protein [Geobacter sp.]|uniref:Spy/CpxP family protein refolding chaperone n=1 Tax=Geobacter sp. TaxID=46610 RepID=UPI0026319B59|nr:hypothetical protein [Geobacter sp.]
MKKTVLVLMVVLSLAGLAVAQTKEEGMAERQGTEMGMCMGPACMAGSVEPDLMAACQVDLDQLGLSPEVLKSLDEKRFDLQKKAIRMLADLQVLRLELKHLLERKDFDLSAARKKTEEISREEARIRILHLEFLSELRAALTEEQWGKLRRMEGSRAEKMGGMMQMMGGMQGMMSGKMMEGMGGMQKEESASRMTREKSEAGVTATISLLNRDGTLTFKVALNTHTVALDQYKFDEIVVLRAGGKEYKGILKSQEGAGHHRSAVLEFENPKTEKVDVIIKDVAGVKERVFEF